MRKIQDLESKSFQGVFDKKSGIKFCETSLISHYFAPNNTG